MNLFRKITTHLALVLSIALVVLVGCGGGRLIPKDLKDFLAKELNTPRHNMEVLQPFRTTIICRIAPTTRTGAREAENLLISKVIEFSKQNNVSDFLNDSLMFVIRLESDADVNMKYYGSANDVREVLSGKLTDSELIERLVKEENWAEELG